MKQHQKDYLPEVRSDISQPTYHAAEPIGDSPCPCCGYLTIPNRGDALAYICPVCKWEIDLFISSTDEPSDQNRSLTLSQARQNYRAYGACVQEFRTLCRPPKDFEKEGHISKRSITIREAEIKDFEEVYALITFLERELLDRDAVRQAYAHNLNKDDVIYYLAFDEDKAVGMVSLHIQHLLHHGAPVAEIQELVVLLPYQGTGLGKRLFDTTKELAISSGCVSLEVCSNRRRQGAYQFYLSQNMQSSHHKLCLKL